VSISEKVNIKVLFTLTLVHFTGDFYSSFISPLFPLFVTKLGLSLAFGLGPLFVTWYAARFGLNALPFTMGFGLVVVLYLYTAVPVPHGEGFKNPGFFGTLKASLGSAWESVALIWVMFLRSLVGQSFLIFMPLLY
jgi:MFS transporter, FSR family, fosmidomycin resistance protein